MDHGKPRNDPDHARTDPDRDRDHYKAGERQEERDILLRRELCQLRDAPKLFHESEMRKRAEMNQSAERYIKTIYMPGKQSHFYDRDRET